MTRRRVTNRLNLPEPYVRAVENDEYDPGHSDYTATSLLQPARMRRLIALYPEGCIQDASELADSLLGQAVHTILERAAMELNKPGRYIVEKRFYKDFIVDGISFKTSAQVDLYDREKRELTDWKTTSAFALQYGPKLDHKMQLALQEDLIKEAGEPPPEVRRITAIVKDWKPAKAAASEAYPEAPALNVEHDAVSPEEVTTWVTERIRAHEHAKLATDQNSPEFPLCNEEETWARTSEDRFAAVRLSDGWTARLLPTREEALAYIASKPHLNLTVEARLGAATRCRDWCPARRICEQWKQSPRNPNNSISAETRDEATASPSATTSSDDDDMVEVTTYLPRRK